MQVVGTTCFRPIGFSELRTLGERTGLDILLLRFDADTVSFDMNLPSLRTGVVRRRRWRREDDVWFASNPL